MASSLADDAVPRGRRREVDQDPCSIPCALVLAAPAAVTCRVSRPASAGSPTAGSRMPTTYKLSAFPVPPCDPMVGMIRSSSRPRGPRIGPRDPGGSRWRRSPHPAGRSRCRTRPRPRRAPLDAGTDPESRPSRTAATKPWSKHGNGAGPAELGIRLPWGGQAGWRQVGNGEPAQNGHPAGPTTTGGTGRSAMPSGCVGTPQGVSEQDVRWCADRQFDCDLAGRGKVDSDLGTGVAGADDQHRRVRVAGR